MPKISVSDLERIRRENNSDMLLRQGHGDSGTRSKQLMLCAGTACVSTRSLEIKLAIEEQLRQHNIDKEVKLISTGCNGFCAVGPVMTVMPDGVFYHSLTKDNVARIVKEHLIDGNFVRELLFTPPGKSEPVPKLADIDFFSRQTLVALKNRGMINPERIDDYIARGGYVSAAKALVELEPDQIISAIKQSGLRGRGGGGFSTGLKWELCSKMPDPDKIIICNADEGDPGAYMDRSIIESDPHSVLEGMLIGARAIGASAGYVYIRAEYPLARQRLCTAIEQAREYGLLGENILGSEFCFDVIIKQGAGAFICGEETSLIASIEGCPPEPRHKPPFPVNSGLWTRPTVINNVETWATVATIIEKGAPWFSSMGTEKSKGTKVFSLVGKIANTGLIEVLMGTTLREIIFGIGGGVPDGKTFKAVQTGGPSGGCIPAEMLDLPVDYERLSEIGSIMGSGGMIVMDEDTCMVDVAKYFVSFTCDESCGKCTSCRDGSEALLGIMEKICNGEGTEEDLSFLEELSLAIKDASMCGLGMTLPNPVLSTLKYFKHEYLTHIHDKKCSAKVCKPLITFSINPERCRGCGVCARNCPVKAVTGEKRMPHVIDASRCIKCGICKQACKAFRIDAVVVE